jgi:acyl-CoA thioesterase FadM
MDNAAAVFVDAPVEEGHGDRAALVTPSGSVSYAQLQRLTNHAGRALRALGVEPEQRGVMLLPEGPAWAATFFAALKLGAVAVPLNTRLAAGDLGAVLADCRPKALVTDRAMVGASAGADLGSLDPGLVFDFDALLAEAPAGPLSPEPVDLGTEALFESLGLPWPEMFPAERIVGVPIVESGARFVSPVRDGDEVRIQTTVSEVRERTFRVEHEVSVAGRPCATGFEVRAWVAQPESPGGALAAKPIPAGVVARLRGESRP